LGNEYPLWIVASILRYPRDVSDLIHLGPASDVTFETTLITTVGSPLK
jgi:hypothetical protein